MNSYSANIDKERHVSVLQWLQIASAMEDLTQSAPVWVWMCVGSSGYVSEKARVGVLHLVSRVSLQSGNLNDISVVHFQYILFLMGQFIQLCKITEKWICMSRRYLNIRGRSEFTAVWWRVLWGAGAAVLADAGAALLLLLHGLLETPHLL